MTDERTIFLDMISGYDYFARGALDVEELCMLIAFAFRLDNVSTPASPNRVYDLLIEKSLQASEACGVPPPQRSYLAPDSRYDEDVHPGGQLTLLLPGTALMIFDDFTVSLGRLLGRLAEEEVPQAGYWIDPEWICVGATLDGFYRSIGELMHRVEFSSRQKIGYSALEAIKIASLRPDSDPERLLDAHVQSNTRLSERAATALDQGSFSEAVSFQEKLIGSFLASALEINGRVARTTLVATIDDAKALDEALRIDHAPDLWERVHHWRKSRNQVIHGQRASIFELPGGLDEQDEFSRKTALLGAELISELRSWSVEARARSLDIGLPRPKRELHRKRDH